MRIKFQENKYRMREILVAALFFFSFLPLVKGQAATDCSALIPMPQKLSWNKQNFKIEGNESRMAQRKVASLPGVRLI